MTDLDKQLLNEYTEGIITSEYLLQHFSADIKKDADFVRKEMSLAIGSTDTNDIQLAIELIWLSSDTSVFVDLLNELLITPYHRSHQRIAKTLQDIRSPTTVPFVRKVLESNFSYLDYTYSESAVITKLFSWLLYSIGTTEAINLMKEYSHSSDEGISKEMLYRLRKVI